MKKFLTCMFAAMLFVPVLSGCGDSSEVSELPKTDESTTGDLSPDEYAAKMQEAEEKAREENE